MSDRICSVCGFDYTNYPDNKVSVTCASCGKTQICGYCASVNSETLREYIKNKSFDIPWKCCECSGREPLPHEEIEMLISLKNNLEGLTLEDLTEGLEDDSDEKKDI